MTASPSKNLERYELLDRVAVGGMAEVYRAKAFGAHGFEKTLAIKRILPELASDPEFQERFIAEAKLAVELSHANVVQLMDFGRFAGSLFIAMEYVDGVDLSALLRDARARDEPLALSVGFQISIELLHGLSFAHQKGVVHRDVSPSNILLSRSGEVKIADFGIALAASEHASQDRGRIMGKWRYMSPEQTRGEKLDSRSDIFSAAAVIYEIFSGEKLFPGGSSREIIENIAAMPIPSLGSRRGEVPAEVDALLAVALERDLAQRDVSAADMLRGLTQASYKSGTVATALDVADRVSRIAESTMEARAEKDAGIDELIRAQLAHVADETCRNTAIAGQEDPARARTQRAAMAVPDAEGRSSEEATVIRRSVDDEGVTVLELAEQGTVAAGPAALRRTGRNQALDGGELSPSGGAPTTERRLPVLRGLVALGVVGAALWAGSRFLGGAPEPGEFALRGADAATPSAQLGIDSHPPGARVRLQGEFLAETTPVVASVEAGAELEVELHLEGFEPYTEIISVPAGERVQMRGKLEPFVAGLYVRSRPSGATVFLDGERIGVTPFTGLELSPGRGRHLRLQLEGYQSAEERIDLVRDETLTLERALKSSVRTGRVHVNVQDSWAEVHFQGKSLGTTPRTLTLPRGKHTLQLINPRSGKAKEIAVTVGGKAAVYNVSLD